MYSSSPNASSPSSSESDASLPREMDTLPSVPAALPLGLESLPLELDPPVTTHLQVCTSISQFSWLVHLYTLTLYILLLQEVDSWSSIDDVDITVDFSFLETPSKAPSSSSPSDESSVSKAKDALKTLLSLEMGTL